MLTRFRVLAVTAATLSCAAIAVHAEAAEPRRTLSLKNAERAIDLAWQAELAGDYPGARAALEDLVKTSTMSMEAPARALIDQWLAGLTKRKAAFDKSGRTARGYHDA